MKAIGDRITFVDEPQRTTVVIYPEKNGWVNALMGAWVAMWLSIGAILTWYVPRAELNQQGWIIMVVFASFWVYYAYKSVRSLLWLYFGKELLKIDEVSLSLKRSIKGYGSAKLYYLENIRKITTDFPEQGSLQYVWENSPWIIGGERFQFEYKGKEIRFGRKLTERDAKLLYSIVTNSIEKKLRKLK